MNTYCSEIKVIGATYHIKQEKNRKTRRKLLCVKKYSELGYLWCLAQPTLNLKTYFSRGKLSLVEVG